MDPSKTRKGCYGNLLADLIQTDIPVYQNFVRVLAAVFDLIKECIYSHTKKEVINFRKPLEVGLKLAITLRHLTTGEMFTSLNCHWLVCQTNIYKFVPKVCRAILDEFQKVYLTCPTTPEDWNQSEEKFRTRLYVPPHSWDTGQKTYRHEEAKEM